METLPIILYVDDDMQCRKVMKMLLSGRMKLPNFFIFEDSSDFIERVEALNPKPSVVFLDIHVKPYTGFEMLTMLRRMTWAKDIPIVALTASVMHEEVQDLRAAGFSGCLAKPLDLSSFPETFHHITMGESVWRIVGS